MEIIKLNLIPSGATPVVHVKQYDIGRTWRFELYEGATVYTLDGTEVLECDVKKLDGNIVTVAVTNTSDNYVDIETTVQMTACSGEQLGALRITKGGDDIATINFILACQRSPLENGIQSDSAIHNLEQQIADAVADQYDADSVVFDASPTAGHGVGFAVTSEGVKNAIDNAVSGLSIPDELNDLSDVDISGQAQGEALVWDGTKWVNGTVSTVGNLDDLSDVDTTGKANGDSLRYDGVEWIAQPTTVALTQAEYDALVLSGDLVPNTHYVITDAPNLNPTASDIEYSSGVTVKQAIDGIGNIISGTVSGTVSCANNTVTEVGSITLDIGRYLIIACIDWATNATGFRQVSFGNSINPARNGATTTSACSGKETYSQVLEFLTVTSDSTVVKAYGWQDSGSSLNAYPYIYAMKIN